MADAVTSQTIIDGERLAIMKFTDISDGVGESAVLKVDVSALAPSAEGKACNGVVINKVHAALAGMSVSVLWDATADVPALVLAPGMYTLDFSDAPIVNNSGAGKTGDISFSTIGATANDTYTIVLEMTKLYAA